MFSIPLPSRGILELMNIPGLTHAKPLTLAALVVVLVGGAAFLILPLILGGGVPGGAGYSVSKDDHISSWTWKGVYKDGAQREADVTKEISHLKDLLGKSGGAKDYDVYVGIATQYELLGDGKAAYQYLSKAITLEPKKGLAYMNMGHLMEEMGAFATAHQAYDAAVLAEPNSPVFKSAQQDFLIHHTSTKP